MIDTLFITPVCDFGYLMKSVTLTDNKLRIDIQGKLKEVDGFPVEYMLEKDLTTGKVHYESLECICAAPAYNHPSCICNVKGTCNSFEDAFKVIREAEQNNRNIK